MEEERNKTNKQAERTNKKNGRATVFKNRKRRKKEGNFLQNFVLSIFFFFLLFSHKSICHQSLKPVQSNFQFTEIKQANFNSANLNFSLFVLSSLFVFSLLKKVEFFIFFQVLIYGFGFNMTSSNITIFSFYLSQCFFKDVT